MKEECNGKLGIVAADPWLEPNEGDLRRRYDRFRARLGEIERGAGSLSDFANGARWYGFNYSAAERGWWFREWLPGACDVCLFGDFNGWDKTGLRLNKGENGDWTIFLPDDTCAGRLTHGSLLKILVHGQNGWHERIPAYIRRVVQDEQTKN
jgi:1,4-alpha-glucan branching enzyme